MADDLNKDVVGARINLDTSKMLPAFKVIDEATRKNAEAFKVLNAELLVSAKNFSDMAKAADKFALTAEERRKKILDESAALVAQRTAQAELLTAKKNMLDTTNQVVDAKLQAQQAIVKKREDAIEQQEKEHQQRMATIQLKMAAAGSQENLLQAKLDRQFQVMKINDAKLEMEAERHQVKMNRFASGDSSVLGRSGQYMLAGTLYYSTIQGAKEAIKVIGDFESSVVNLRRVMNSNADIGFVKKSMIEDAKQYGYALKDVGDVYVQIAQQGFNERDTAALAKTALMAANVESSFKDAANAQELLTGAVLNYNMKASESERLLDRINQVSNDYATDSKKLLEGINGVGAAAHNAGEPIDLLIGQLTVLNQAGFTGSEAGNAIKSFISFSTRDIAVNKLQEYVGTIKQANGAMMPFSEILSKVAERWKTLSDVQRNEVTQAIARGNQTSKFIALMDNYDQVLKAATTSENSLGSAQRENTLAMSALQKQAAQLKASWEGLMISIGDSGLLSVLKDIVHESKLLVDGFNSLPAPIRNTLTVTLELGAGIAVLNTGLRLLTGQSLVSLVTGLVTATRTMFGMTAATETATVAQRAFIATPIGATLSVLAAVIGIVTVAWSHHNGAMNETRQTMDANQKEAFTLTDRYQQLKKIVDDNTKSDKEIKTAKTELAGVIEKVSALMPNLISQWDAHGKAIDLNITKLDEWKRKYAESVVAVENANIKQNQAKLDQLKKDEAGLDEELKQGEPIRNPYTRDSVNWINRHANGSADIHGDILDKGKEISDIEQKIKASQDILDLVNRKPTPSSADDKTHTGSKTDAEIKSDYSDRKAEFDASMNAFRHQVNLEAAGYKDANNQLEKLKEIRSEFGDLGSSSDYARLGLNSDVFYSIDEEIYRTSQGKGDKAKGMGTTKAPKAFVFKLDDIDTQKVKAEQSINDAMALIDEYAAKEFSLSNAIDKTSEKVGLYANHQNKLHQSNEMLRDSVDTLTQRQNILNELYNSGKINADDYDKSTQDVQSRLKTFTEDINRNSIAWWNDAKAMKDAKEQQLKDAYDFSSKWVAHQKAIGELTAQQEYEAWGRVDERYKQGSELRMQADEQVYAAKKALIQDEETKISDLVNKEKSALEEAKQAELDRIDKAKRDYVDAQDAKIKALDQLIQAEDRANADQDYAAQLKEKQDRLSVLQAAVGPDGIKERKQVLKDITDMELKHQQDLTKRAHETEKQRLEDEKTAKEKAFDDEKSRVEQHYTDLLKPLDNFKNDVEGRAEAIKQIQIVKDSEKNAEILKNLDPFIAQYQAKMASIASLNQAPTQSEEQRDLQRYNSNIDKWSNGDQAAKDAAHADNEMLRQKYNIPADTGKLQHFADGGIVRGMKSQAVPVIAHGGEMFLNQGQQANLFKLLNFSLPKIDFRMPDFQMSSGASVVNNYTFNNSVNSGDTHLHDQADIKSYYSERDSLIGRMQVKQGKKIR